MINLLDWHWELRDRPQQILQEKKQILLEIQAARYSKKIRANRPGLQARFLIKIGDFMISSGLKLKNRYQAVCEPAYLPKLKIQEFKR